MIIDIISNMERYCGALPALKTVIKTLKEVDFKNLPVGQYKTDDPSVRYNVFAYDADADRGEKAEFHVKEIDVQILISGSEKMDLSSEKNETVVQAYNPETDCGFVADLPFVNHFAEPGRFTLLFPGEPHCTSMKYGKDHKVKKVVFKILY